MEKALKQADTIAVGRWWFRQRGVSPLPVVVLCLLLPPNRILSPAQLVLVALGLLLAEAARIWAVGYAGSATRTRGDTVPGLVHAGPFRHVRNPLYIANITLYTLCGIGFGFTWFAVAIAAYFFIQYTFIVAFEEDTLRREFGPAYGLYCARVPRWLPKFTPQVPASSHSFSLKKSLRSERATLLALATIIFLYFLKRSFF